MWVYPVSEARGADFSALLVVDYFRLTRMVIVIVTGNNVMIRTTMAIVEPMVMVAPSFPVRRGTPWFAYEAGQGYDSRDPGSPHSSHRLHRGSLRGYSGRKDEKI